MVTLKAICKTYHLDAVDVPALIDINLEIRPHCFTVISGPSGSGKTTLLNLIGCIDRPDSGEIEVAGQRGAETCPTTRCPISARAHIGFIFQNFNLLPVLTAYENVEYPLLLARVPAAQRKQRVEALLDGGRACGQGATPAGTALRRPAPARRDRACARAVPQAGAGRRADREPRQPHRRGDHRTDARGCSASTHVSFVFSSHDPQVLAEADDAVMIRDGCVVAVERQGEPARRRGNESLLRSPCATCCATAAARSPPCSR